MTERVGKAKLRRVIVQSVDRLLSVVTVQLSVQQVKSQRTPIEFVKTLTGLRHCLNHMVVGWALSMTTALEGRIVWAHRENT